MRRPRALALAGVLVALGFSRPGSAEAGDPQYIQYIESPYRFERELKAFAPRTSGLFSDLLVSLGSLSNVSVTKYERTRFNLLVQGTHPIEFRSGDPFDPELDDEIIESVPRRREVYAGNIRARLADYHMVDFGPLYSLVGNRYENDAYLTYIQERRFTDDEEDQLSTVDVDLDGRSFAEVGHQFADSPDPMRSGLRLGMKTQYRDGDEFQVVLEDDFDEFRWLVTAELFFYREVLRHGQRPHDLLDPQPYPLEYPPRLALHARIQQHVARSGYDARSKGLQAVVTAIWSPEIMEWRPSRSLHVFPQVEEEVRCGITGGDLEGECTVETSPSYRFIAARLRSPFALFGFSKNFEGIEGDMSLRLKTVATVDFQRANFGFEVSPQVELALRFF